MAQPQNSAVEVGPGFGAEPEQDEDLHPTQKQWEDAELKAREGRQPAPAGVRQCAFCLKTPPEGGTFRTTTISRYWQPGGCAAFLCSSDAQRSERHRNSYSDADIEYMLIMPSAKGPRFVSPSVVVASFLQVAHPGTLA